MRFILLLFTFSLLFMITSCKKEKDVHPTIEFELGSAMDVDSNQYQTVNIGGLMWFTENLRVTKFRNGDPLFHVQNEDQWDSLSYLSIPVWCYANYDSTTVGTHGLMYNYWAVVDPRGIAPEGWHISNKEEWQKLIDENGGEWEAGFRLKSRTGWSEGQEGNNITMFNAKPGGQLLSTGDMLSYGKNGYWWTSSPTSSYGGRHTVLLPGQNYLVNIIEYGNDDGAIYIRCVEDY